MSENEIAIAVMAGLFAVIAATISAIITARTVRRSKTTLEHEAQNERPSDILAHLDRIENFKNQTLENSFAAQIGNTLEHGSLTNQNQTAMKILEKLRDRHADADFSGLGGVVLQIEAAAEEYGKLKTELHNTHLDLQQTKRDLEAVRAELAAEKDRNREPRRDINSKHSYGMEL